MYNIEFFQYTKKNLASMIKPKKCIFFIFSVFNCDVLRLRKINEE